jgi:BON domain-containing protein
MTRGSRDPRWWLGAGFIVAASFGAAYYLDPRRGHRRRRRLARSARYALTSARGKAGHLVVHEPMAPADGRMLLDRVESELFEDRSIPHGRFNLDVEGKTVVLRGQLDNAEQMAKLEAAVARVPGVSGVRSFLHVPGTPAPNKAAALAASAEAAHPTGWPREAPPDVDSQG